MVKKTKTGKTKAAKKKSRLIGFARLRVTDPDKLRAISKRAGKRAQRLHGKRIRWTKTEARKMAKIGGKAVQQAYRKEGHPLQIAQVRRAAQSERIKAGMRKRKALVKPVVSEDQSSRGALRMEQELAAEHAGTLEREVHDPEPDPVPEKDVVNG